MILFNKAYISGVPLHLQKDYPPNRIAMVLTQFAKEVEVTKHQINLDKEKEKLEAKRKVRRHTSMIEVNANSNEREALIARY